MSDPFEQLAGPPRQTAPSSGTPTLPGVSGDAGSMAMRYTAAVPVGALKGGANLLDMIASGGNAQQEAEASAGTGQEPVHTDIGTPVSNVAHENLFKPKDQVEAGLQGAGEGAVENAMFGPQAAALGSIGGGVTGWQNAASPDTPGRNALLGAAASMAPWRSLLKIGKSVGQAAGILKEDNPLLQAQRDLDVTNRNAAGIGEDKSWRKSIRDLRDSWLSSSINDREQEGRRQVEAAFDKRAGPEVTKEQAGNTLQNAGEEWARGASGEKAQLATRSLILDRMVDPSTTQVDMAPIIAKMKTEFSGEPGVPNTDTGAVDLASQIEQEATKYAYQQQYGQYWAQNMANGSPLPNGLKIPLSSLKYLKNGIGEDYIGDIVRGSDTAVKNNKIAYGTLANAEADAYRGTPYFADAQQLKSDWGNYFTHLENDIAPYLKENMNAGPAYRGLVNESTVGGEQIARTLSLLPPEAKAAVASAKIRDLATDTSGQFNPGTFAKNWDSFKKLSPEAKEALFGPVARDYDKIALVSQEQARSEAARNTSGTGGVVTAFKMFSKFAGAGAALAIGNEVYNGNDDLSSMGRSSAALGSAAGAIGTLGAMSMGARLFSNPGFVRLLATNPPIEKLPLALKALAVNTPQLSTEITAFQNYVANEHQQQQNDPFEQLAKPKGFMAGGLANFPNQDSMSFADGGEVTPIKPISPFLPYTDMGDTIDDHVRLPNPDKMNAVNDNKNRLSSDRWRKMADGGTVNDGGTGKDTDNSFIEPPATNFVTPLNQDQEQLFQQWKQQNAPNDSGEDYDLRGAYTSGFTPDPQTGHWPDVFKKPNHPTFSDQSKYSKQYPDLPHGNWLDDVFQPPANYALGGLTDMPKHLLTGGALFDGTNNPIPYKRGGPVNILHKLYDDQSTDSNTGFAEGGSVHKVGSLHSFGNGTDQEKAGHLEPQLIPWLFVPDEKIITPNNRNNFLDFILPKATNEFAEGGEVKEEPKFADGDLGALQRAVFHVESGSGTNYNPAPTKGHSASGPMQIIPTTFAMHALPGESLTDFKDNMRVGLRLVTKLYNQYGGDIAKAAYSYANGSPDAPDQNPGYVKAIFNHIKKDDPSIKIPDIKSVSTQQTNNNSVVQIPDNEEEIPEEDTTESQEEPNPATNILLNADWVSPQTKAILRG